MGTMIIGGGAIIFLLLLIIFPEFRKGLKVLVGGFLGLFVQNAAKTPEGAKAIYQQKISELQDEYNKASDILNKAAGELAEHRRRYEQLDRLIEDCRQKATSCVQRGHEDQARVFTEQWAEYEAEQEALKPIIEKLTAGVRSAKSAHEMYAKRLKEIQAEAKRTVSEMELNKNLSGLLKELDDLRADTATDKLVEAVRESSADLRKEATGGMIVHQNRLSTRVAQAEAVAAGSRSDAHLQELMARYAPKQALPGQSSAIPLDITQSQKTKIERK